MNYPSPWTDSEKMADVRQWFWVPLFLLPFLAWGQTTTNKPFDLVICNGRIIDPATHRDTVGLNIGIRGSSIAELSIETLKGLRTIDARGDIVAPGFIDILSYSPNRIGVWNKIADGVTTNLAMHGGAADPVSWYAAFKRQHPPVNFGASFFYIEARIRFINNRYKSATPDQIRRLTAIAERALKNGALGISFSLEYCPGISPDEILPLMRLAKQYNVPVFFHARYSDMEEPGTNIDALAELIGYARVTGASIHIDHLNSTGGTFSMKRSLSMIDSARAEGLDISACTYPYTYWGTYLNSARFDKGWQQRFHISYQNLQLAGSTERLTKESFEKYRKLGRIAVAYAIPEEDVEEALRSPFVMIGSDAILTSGFNNHPRASGTFARTIAVYVREKRILSLSDAIAKMTILPARRLEKNCAALKRKGRIARGADADIVIFSFSAIADRATVDKPYLSSAGIDYVVVNGKVVKDLAGIHKDIRPGRAIVSDAALKH
jgi:N-acyl-D-aspartate/D-glutamate deacylase